ncbi:MAG: hypothetical protein ABIF88_00125 [archaeon]
MEKMIGVIFVLMLVVGFVVADEDWDSFIGGDSGSTLNDSSGSLVNGVDDSGGAHLFPSIFSGEYNMNFYVAVAVAIIGVGIIFYLAWAFFRKPKNKWKKS